MFHGHLDYIQKPPLWGRPNTKLGYHGTPKSHNRWFLIQYFTMCEDPAWIEIYWNSICWGPSHIWLHSTWFWKCILGWAFRQFFWALTISWLWFLARVWRGPWLRTTSHTRSRARDHCISSTLIGGKGGAGPEFASHYTWGTNRVCECKMDVKSMWIPTRHQMDHVTWSLGLFSKTTSWR